MLIVQLAPRRLSSGPLEEGIGDLIILTFSGIDFIRYPLEARKFRHYPERRWRRIAPHAIGLDGSWIIDTCDTKLSEVGPDADAGWNEQVILEIGPHPELSDTQQKVIALDYKMLSGRAKIPVRRALFYCALERLGLVTDPRARRPQGQQIVLLNREAVTSGDDVAAGAHG